MNLQEQKLTSVPVKRKSPKGPKLDNMYNPRSPSDQQLINPILSIIPLPYPPPDLETKGHLCHFDEEKNKNNTKLDLNLKPPLHTKLSSLYLSMRLSDSLTTGEPKLALDSLSQLATVTHIAKKNKEEKLGNTLIS